MSKLNHPKIVAGSRQKNHPVFPSIIYADYNEKLSETLYFRTMDSERFSICRSIHIILLTVTRPRILYISTEIYIMPRNTCIYIYIYNYRPICLYRTSIQLTVCGTRQCRQVVLDPQQKGRRKLGARVFLHQKYVGYNSYTLPRATARLYLDGCQTVQKPAVRRRAELSRRTVLG